MTTIWVTPDVDLTVDIEAARYFTASCPPSRGLRPVLSTQGPARRNSHLCPQRQPCQSWSNFRFSRILKTQLQPLPSVVQENACPHRDSVGHIPSLSLETGPQTSVDLEIRRWPCNLAPIPPSCEAETCLLLQGPTQDPA